MAILIKEITVLMGKKDRESGKGNINIVRKAEDQRPNRGSLLFCIRLHNQIFRN